MNAPSHPSVMFLCSSGLHVRLLAPAMQHVQRTGSARAVVLSLDAFYPHFHGDVEQTVKDMSLNVPVHALPFAHGHSNNRWLRALQTIESARLRGFFTLRRIFQQERATLLVVGNDTGLAEQTAIDASRSCGMQALLVQDGFLTDPFPAGAPSVMHALIRRLRRASIGKLIAGGDYGMGGCTHIAAYGDHWVSVFEHILAGSDTQVHLIGHPYLPLHQLPSVPLAPGEGEAVYFCTNFLRSNLDDRNAHEKQIDEVLALAAILGPGRCLRVRLHPADDPQDYGRIEGVPGVRLLGAAPLAQVIDDAWFCITNISSVALECAARGKVCLMSSWHLEAAAYARIHSSLPGIKFADGPAFQQQLQVLSSDSGRVALLKQQARSLAPYFCMRSTLSGSERLGALVLRLALPSD